MIHINKIFARELLLESLEQLKFKGLNKDSISASLYEDNFVYNKEHKILILSNYIYGLNENEIKYSYLENINQEFINNYLVHNKVLFDESCNFKQVMKKNIYTKLLILSSFKLQLYNLYENEYIFTEEDIIKKLDKI